MIYKEEDAIIDKAKNFAIRAHEGQKYGTHSYSVHLLEVYKVAEKFQLSDNIKAACFLHDILEDTNVKYYQLKNMFGMDIAELVYGVTDELGRNRKECKQKTHLKIVEMGVSCAILKLCDRIANMENAKRNENSILNKYIEEHKDFSMIYHKLGITDRAIYKYYLNFIF